MFNSIYENYYGENKEIYGIIAIIILCFILLIGINFAAFLTVDSDVEYVSEAVVTKVDSYKRSHFSYFQTYKVYAVSENGDVYTDEISETEYATINIGDVVKFKVNEVTNCFGRTIKSKYSQ